MYKIGIIGSGPERFVDKNKVQRLIGARVDLLGFQYGKEDTVFNIRANIGVGLWAAAECKERSFKYHMFLPYPLEITYEHWYNDQKNQLRDQYFNAYSLTICHTDINQNDASYKNLVGASNFIVCFWPGNKQGKVFEGIKFALGKNKIVLNGLDDLKLVTNEDTLG